MRISKLPASQQLVGTVNPACDQPRTPALPLRIDGHLLGFGTSPTCLTSVPSHIHHTRPAEQAVP